MPFFDPVGIHDRAEGECRCPFLSLINNSCTLLQFAAKVQVRLTQDCNNGYYGFLLKEDILEAVSASETDARGRFADSVCAICIMNLLQIVVD